MRLYEKTDGEKTHLNKKWFYFFEISKKLHGFVDYVPVYAYKTCEQRALRVSAQTSYVKRDFRVVFGILSNFYIRKTTVSNVTIINEHDERCRAYASLKWG